MKMKRSVRYAHRFGSVVQFVRIEDTIDRDMARKNGWKAVPDNQFEDVKRNLIAAGMTLREEMPYPEFCREWSRTGGRNVSDVA